MPDFPILKLGSQGYYVRLLQLNLNGLGANYNNFPINGIFDIKTEQALIKYQDKYDLLRDGIAGSDTWKVITNNVKVVQNLLNIRKYNAGAPDGWFEQKTIDAVLSFQKNNKLCPYGFIAPRTRRRLFNPYPKDDYEYRPSSNSINSLDPFVATLAKRFLELTRLENLDIRIIAAFRSWDDSDMLYSLGRCTPGNIVSNVRGGESFHNWGLAFDAAFFENGMISYDIKKYIELGRLGKQVGLKWGGDFVDIKDYDHFQYVFGLNIDDLLNGITFPNFQEIIK